MSPYAGGRKRAKERVGEAKQLFEEQPPDVAAVGGPEEQGQEAQQSMSDVPSPVLDQPEGRTVTDPYMPPEEKKHQDDLKPWMNNSLDI